MLNFITPKDFLLNDNENTIYHPIRYQSRILSSEEHFTGTYDPLAAIGKI